MPVGWKKPDQNLSINTNNSNVTKPCEKESINIDPLNKNTPAISNVPLLLLSDALPIAISVNRDIARPPPVINPISV